jgi:hypothetical protein
MTKSRITAIIAAVICAAGLRSGVVRAAEPTTQQLKQQLEQLQAKVQQLEATQQAQQATTATATADQVARDAQQRSQLFAAEGFTAGFDKGRFVIQDAAGKNVFRPTFQMQYRWVANYRKDATTGGDDDWENGFEMRRFKFGADGNIIDPKLTYYFLLAADRDGGGVALDQAWAKYQFADEWSIRLGQIVNPTFHEEGTSGRRLLTADRSLTNSLITGTTEPLTQVVTAIYEPKKIPLQTEFGLEDGFESDNSTFVDPGAGGATDFGVFARANYFVKGDRKSYDDFTALGNKNDLLVFGAGIDATQASGVTSYKMTADGQWETTKGLGVYGAILGNMLDFTAGDTSFDFGFLAQASYMLNAKWEVFGRYDVTKLDILDQTYNEITVGANWYLGGGHNCKVTLDLSLLPDGSPANFGGLGVLANDDLEIVVRGQFQLLL